MKECVKLAREAGISDEKIILDSGVGFGKTYDEGGFYQEFYQRLQGVRE